MFEVEGYIESPKPFSPNVRRSDGEQSLEEVASTATPISLTNRHNAIKKEMNLNAPLEASAPRITALPVAMIVCCVSAALAIVGALGPWARVPTYEASYGSAAAGEGVFRVMGLDAPGMVPIFGDGTVILVMVSISAALILWRMIWPPKSSGFILSSILCLLLLSAVIATVNWAYPGYIPQADSRTYFKNSVEVSWGLMLLSIGIWPGVIAAAYQLWYDELR